MKIAKSACDIGLTATAQKFSKTLGKPVAYTTVQSIRNDYWKKLREDVQDPLDISSLPLAKRGRPLLIGEELDSRVLQHIMAIRKEGGCISLKIILGAAIGILKATRPSALKVNGGPLSLTKHWAKSFATRHKLVKRKATKAAKKIPSNFQEVKDGFLQRIKSTVQAHSIPHNLIVNVDETGLPIVPVRSYTLEVCGEKQVPVTANNDKRQITAVVGCSFNGKLLAPQLLYEGKTDRCHPSVSFPADWDIFHTESHWSNSASVIRYIDNVLRPYFDKQKELLDLPVEQKSLLIFDVFRAHRTEDVLSHLESNNILVIFVPANCTSELQPLDLSVNGPLKRRNEEKFADRVCVTMLEYNNNIDVVASQLQIDLRTSVVKPLHAEWTIISFREIGCDTAEILRGWAKAGISAILEEVSSLTTDGNSSSEEWDIED